MPFKKHTYTHGQRSALHKLEFHNVCAAVREVKIRRRTSSGVREHPVYVSDARISVISPNNRQQCTPWSVYSVHV